MNGGNKLYIHKDGFGDVYNATPLEEAEWAKEIIANALKRIDTEENATVLKFAIESLQFHKYPELKALLMKKLKEAGPAKQVVLATALWSNWRYNKSFDILYQNLLQHRNECLNNVFLGLGEFKENDEAKKFLITCFEGDDDILIVKAYVTIGMWAYSGIPALRNNNLLELLHIENKNESTFKEAVEQLKQVFWPEKINP